MEKDTQNYREWLEAIAANKDLRGEDFRVLLLLMANASYNRILISQSEIASKLQVSKSCVSRALNRLFTRGVITKSQFNTNTINYCFSSQKTNEQTSSH